MSEKEMPGYLDVGGVLVHVAEIRRYTSDTRRFRKYLPIVKELERYEAHSV